MLLDKGHFKYCSEAFVKCHISQCERDSLLALAKMICWSFLTICAELKSFQWCSFLPSSESKNSIVLSGFASLGFYRFNGPCSNFSRIITTSIRLSVDKKDLFVELSWKLRRDVVWRVISVAVSLSLYSEECLNETGSLVVLLRHLCSIEKISFILRS